MLFFTFYSHEWIYVWESAWSQYEQRRFGHVVLIQCWKWGWCTRDLLLRKHVSVKTRKEGHGKPLPSNKSHTHHAAWYRRYISLKSRQVSIGSILEILTYNPVVGDKLIPSPSLPSTTPSLGRARLGNSLLYAREGHFLFVGGREVSDNRTDWDDSHCHKAESLTHSTFILWFF